MSKKLQKMLAVLSVFCVFGSILYVKTAGAISTLDSENVYFSLNYEQRQGLAPETPLKSVEDDGEFITLKFSQKDVKIHKNDVNEDLEKIIEGSRTY